MKKICISILVLFIIAILSSCTIETETVTFGPSGSSSYCVCSYTVSGDYNDTQTGDLAFITQTYNDTTFKQVYCDTGSDGYLTGFSSPSGRETTATLLSSPRSKLEGHTRLPTFSIIRISHSERSSF